MSSAHARAPFVRSLPDTNESRTALTAELSVPVGVGVAVRAGHDVLRARALEQGDRVADA